MDRNYVKMDIGKNSLKKAHELACGTKDIAMYLCANSK